MTVRAVLNSKGHQVVSIEPTSSLAAAVQMLTERRIGAVLVMTGQRISGILSERDIVRALSERGAAALDEPVRVAMTSDVTTCQPGDTIPAIMEVMTLSKFRHLPVVDEGRLVGIPSLICRFCWR